MTVGCRPLLLLPATMKSRKIRYISTFLFFALLTTVSSSTSSSRLSLAQISTMTDLAHQINNQTTVSSSWNSSTDPCSWLGVTCIKTFSSSSTPTTVVSNLSVSKFGLTNSSFLLTACEITTLEYLDVSRNLLSSIPDGFVSACGKSTGLKSLNFSSNRISGSFPDFNAFTRLEFLDFSYNSLSGKIESQLNELTTLKSLILSFNQISGSIPLGKSMSLEELQLTQNTFEGEIPEELADYKNLTVIDLSKNSLSGKIPTRIAELSNLQTLVLSNNSLSGSIPQALTRITTLSRFAANQNRFNGTIPSGFSELLENLDLSFNNLSGSIPGDLLRGSHRRTVDLSSNRLGGSLPGNVSSSSLIRLRLGSNLLTGMLPSGMCSNLSSLVYLELENNHFNGSIPADFGLCKNLQLLSLGGNQFSGELPVHLGNLNQLKVLSLQSNSFVGQIPTEITLLTNLSTLNMSWNSLNGAIPSSISHLIILQSLELQGNHLNGSIPSSMVEMKNLAELNLGNNQLGGEIPSMPPRLQYSLNLSSNLFHGFIPGSLGGLNSLEVLDLSNNHFSGQIPDDLTDMDSLIALYLSNNNLSGNMPRFKKAINVVTTPGNKDLMYTILGPGPVGSHKRISVRTTVAIAVAAGFTGIVIAFLVFALARRFSRKRETKIESREEENAPTHLIEGQLLTSSTVHKSNIHFGRALEAVGDSVNLVLNCKFSTYYKVVMPSGSSYFVKRLSCRDQMLQDAHQDFRDELKILGKLNNSNIMVPLAYMLTEENIYLLYEYAHKGTLFDILHSSLRTGLDWPSRYNIAIGLARGLAFLHGQFDGPILLFDFSSRSVMLRSLKEPQIADIELCKVIDPSKSTSSLSAVAGSIGYIPPEYAYTMRITTAGNVYSFGVILLELLTGKPAMSEGIELAKWVVRHTSEQKNWAQILDLCVSRTSPAVRSQMVAVLRIALACVDVYSEARPQMKSVPRMLLNAR